MKFSEGCERSLLAVSADSRIVLTGANFYNLQEVALLPTEGAGGRQPCIWFIPRKKGP